MEISLDCCDCILYNKLLFSSAVTLIYAVAINGHYILFLRLYR